MHLYGGERGCEGHQCSESVWRLGRWGWVTEADLGPASRWSLQGVGEFPVLLHLLMSIAISRLFQRELISSEEQKNWYYNLSIRHESI